MSLTAYHAKYFAHDLTRRSVGGIDRLSMALFDASVDLNPHQIEAALVGQSCWSRATSLVAAPRKFYKRLIKKADGRFDAHLDRTKEKSHGSKRK